MQWWYLRRAAPLAVNRSVLKLKVFRKSQISGGSFRSLVWTKMFFNCHLPEVLKTSKCLAAKLETSSTVAIQCPNPTGHLIIDLENLHGKTWKNTLKLTIWRDHFGLPPHPVTVTNAGYYRDSLLKEGIILVMTVTGWRVVPRDHLLKGAAFLLFRLETTNPRMQEGIYNMNVDPLKRFCKCHVWCRFS